MGFDDIFDGAPSEGAAIFYDRFSRQVREELGLYVYRLVDPRNGETFYVGKGRNNRVFDHMDEAEDARRRGRKRSDKIKRILSIHDAGKKVETVIHRHALRDDDEVSTLEAALIQAYPDLTNEVAGEGTRLFGARATDAAIKAYDEPPAQLQKHKCLLLSLTEDWPESEDDEPTAWSDLYTRTRHAWDLDVKRARSAEWVVGHAKGIVRAVFSAEAWLEADDPVFAGFPRSRSRGHWGFIGRPAKKAAWDSWVGRRIPDRYRSGWSQRVRYVNV